MSHVCCRYACFERAIIGMEHAEVRIFNHGNLSVQGLPRICTCHIEKMGETCAVAVELIIFNILTFVFIGK